MSFLHWFTLNNCNFWSQVTSSSWCPNIWFHLAGLSTFLTIFYSWWCCTSLLLAWFMWELTPFSLIFRRKRTNMHLGKCYIQENWNVFGVVVGQYMLLGGQEVKKNYSLWNCTILGFTLQVIEKERIEKSRKLDELKQSGQILLDHMGKGEWLEGFSIMWFNHLSYWDSEIHYLQLSIAMYSFPLPPFSCLQRHCLLLLLLIIDMFSFY